MKKTMALILIVIPMLSAAILLPRIIEKGIDTVSITTVGITQYSDGIRISGYIEPVIQKELIAEIPLVPERVYVAVGDEVKVGDIIADVDAAATKQSLYNAADAINIIPKEYIEAIASMNIDESMIKDNIPKEIIATASGVITSLSIAEGCAIMPQSTMAVIAKSSMLRLVMSVDEQYADQVESGDTVVFKANATGDIRYAATVERVFPSASKAITQTGQETTVSMYVSPQIEYPRLKAGYSVEGVVKKQEDRDIYLLPYEAIMQDDSNQEYIYIVGRDGLERCNIVTGRELSAGVEVVSPNLIGKGIVADASQVTDLSQRVRLVQR